VLALKGLIVLVLTAVFRLLPPFLLASAYLADEWCFLPVAFVLGAGLHLFEPGSKGCTCGWRTVQFDGRVFYLFIYYTSSLWEPVGSGRYRREIRQQDQQNRCTEANAQA